MAEASAAPTGDRLDYAAVRSYWEQAAREPGAASYMAHEQGLPPSCVEHRFRLERAVVDRWLAGLGPGSSILDLGCGAGTWTELFAGRFRRVVGVEASEGMLAAARQRLGGRANVELVAGDARRVELAGPFDGAFLGGMLMYLDRADAVAVLRRLRVLVPDGPIVLRESGVRAGVEVHGGSYPVVYRSVEEYRDLAAEAGQRVTEVAWNRGYAHMEVAVELVDLARRLPPLARRDPSVTGRPVWALLAATAPLSLEVLPRAVAALGVDWPHLRNHFYLLEPGEP